MNLFKNTNIDFIGKRNIFYSFSILFILIGLGAFIKNKGPILGIEFSGGTLIQIGFKDLPPVEQIRASLNKVGWDNYSLQTQPADNSLIVRTKQGEKSKDALSNEFLAALKTDFAGNVKEFPDQVEYVGPVVGKKLLTDAIKAILGSMAVIVIYVAFRFKSWTWGAVGVLALLHDVFITWGLLTLMGKETTLVVIAALLTLAGYSINDTIVIFDRVRENLKTGRRESRKDMYNRSINETLGRTLNTSLMALLAASSLFFGGEVIRDFALAMSFGILIGSYSTIAVAISLVHQFETWGDK